MPRPLVSFVLPMYNGAKTIEETIRSLQAQTVTDWEAVIVNDGSTDAGPAIIERMAKADPRLRMVHRANGGRAKARNTGLDAVAGEYILMMDADDLLLPDALADLLQAARLSPSRASAGQITAMGPDGVAFDDPPGPSYAGDEVSLGDWLNLNGFQIVAHLIHRDTLGSTRKRETVPINEDLDLFLILACQGVRWRFVHKPVAVYRYHPVQRDLDQLRWYLRLWNDAFERARAAGWADRGVDVSAERQRRTLAKAAWQIAQMTIIQDQTPGKDLMAQMINFESRGPLAIDPYEAGASAHALTPMAEWRPISAWRTEARRYLANLTPWWRRCVAEGWAGPGFVEQATAALLQRLTAQQDPVSELLDGLDDARPVVILGLGQNGVRIVREMNRRGRRVIARDDGLNAARAAQRLAPVPLTFIDRERPYDAGAVYLMSVLDDGQYLARLPVGLTVRRWADVVRQAEDRVRASLLESKPAGCERVDACSTSAARAA